MMKGKIQLSDPAFPALSLVSPSPLPPLTLPYPHLCPPPTCSYTFSFFYFLSPFLHIPLFFLLSPFLPLLLLVLPSFFLSSLFILISFFRFPFFYLPLPPHNSPLPSSPPSFPASQRYFLATFFFLYQNYLPLSLSSLNSLHSHCFTSNLLNHFPRRCSCWGVKRRSSEVKLSFCIRRWRISKRVVLLCLLRITPVCGWHLELELSRGKTKGVVSDSHRRCRG